MEISRDFSVINLAILLNTDTSRHCLWESEVKFNRHLPRVSAKSKTV